MNYKFQLGHIQLIVNCDSDYQAQVDDLFAKLVELDKKGPSLGNGTAIDFGWSRLVLKGSKTELVVNEPDFFHDPFHHFLPRVDFTMKVLISQVSILNYLQIEGVTASFSDQVILRKNCLNKDKIYLERSEDIQERDSGWYIAEVDTINGDDSLENYENMYVYQLLQRRPEIMQLLALPPGYMVVMVKDSIIQVFNPEGKDVWI
jgi:hypothetical protein